MCPTWAHAVASSRVLPQVSVFAPEPAADQPTRTRAQPWGLHVARDVAQTSNAGGQARDGTESLRPRDPLVAPGSTSWGYVYAPAPTRHLM